MNLFFVLSFLNLIPAFMKALHSRRSASPLFAGFFQHLRFLNAIDTLPAVRAMRSLQAHAAFCAVRSLVPVALFLISGISLMVPGCMQDLKQPDSSGDLLWYDQPASEWMEALPLGNGHLGVMVFGDTATERIQLNDDSLWPGKEDWSEPPGGPADLQKLRGVLMAGDHQSADRMFVNHFSNLGITRSHQTLGDLHLQLDHNNISGYRRTLDLGRAVTEVSYRTNGHMFRQEVFVSHPHHAICIRLTSESPGGINGSVMLSRPADSGIPTVEVQPVGDRMLRMKGEVTQFGGTFRSQPAPVDNGIRFETLLYAENTDGAVTSGTNGLEIAGASAVDLYIVSNSSWYTDAFGELNLQEIDFIRESTYETIRQQHIADHMELYERVQLDLGGDKYDTIPINERLARVRNGMNDNGLEELLYQYGRYLLIASSRPGTNPANLQGLWNEHIRAPWNADYHLNINLQMNYWLADMTGLPELNDPLYDFIDRLVENGKTTARKNFGCRGTFMPHATDLWAPTWLRAATAYWGCSMPAGGWMMQHYWYGFEYSRDTAFLEERVYPALREVATFYSDWLIRDPRDGTLVSAPSTSPENRFFDQDGNQVATCMGSAMDQQVIAEVFDHFIEASEILGTRPGILDTIRDQREQLRPGFVTGSDGRILEWDREYSEPEPGHRHMSHLYGFHPGSAVSPEKDPGIFAAVRRTLEHRLENGGAGTGWSRAWLINCSARLLDGEMAYAHIQLFLQRSVASNMFDMHPPFQIDGNFGYTAGVTEMLLQSYESGVIRLLPALPQAWSNGSVTGLRARNNITVDMQWSNGSLQHAQLVPRYNCKVRIVYPEGEQTVTLKAGVPFRLVPDI